MKLKICETCLREYEVDFQDICAWCNPGWRTGSVRFFAKEPDLSLRLRRLLTYLDLEGTANCRERFTAEELSRYKNVGQKTLAELGYEKPDEPRCEHCGARRRWWKKDVSKDVSA